LSNDGSVFQTRDPRYDGKTDHFFNESGRFEDPHGHVVESKKRSTPTATQYDYARDASGTQYQVAPTPGNPNGYDQSRY